MAGIVGVAGGAELLVPTCEVLAASGAWPETERERGEGGGEGEREGVSTWMYYINAQVHNMYMNMYVAPTHVQEAKHITFVCVSN